MKTTLSILAAFALLAGCAAPSLIPSGDAVIAIYSESYADSPRTSVKIFFDPIWSTDEKAEYAAKRVWEETMGGQKYDTCKQNYEGTGVYRFQYTYRRSEDPERVQQYNLHLSLPDRSATYNTPR
jgi:hypothetical protein